MFLKPEVTLSWVTAVLSASNAKLGAVGVASATSETRAIASVRAREFGPDNIAANLLVSSAVGKQSILPLYQLDMQCAARWKSG